MDSDDIDLIELAALVSRCADEEILPRFQRVSASKKADGSLLTEADLAMQQRLAEVLLQRWPDIGLLGEEMTAEAQQALLASSEDGLWVLDPIDGTSNFAAGLPLFPYVPHGERYGFRVRGRHTRRRPAAAP